MEIYLKVNIEILMYKNTGISYCKRYFQWNIKGTKRGKKSGKNFEDRFHTSTSNEIFFRKDKSFRVCMKMFISKIKINDFSKI